MVPSYRHLCQENWKTSKDHRLPSPQPPRHQGNTPYPVAFPSSTVGSPREEFDAWNGYHGYHSVITYCTVLRPVCLSALHAAHQAMTSKAEASPGITTRANCSQCNRMAPSQALPLPMHMCRLLPLPGLQLHCNYRSILQLAHCGEGQGWSHRTHQRPTTHVRHIWHTGRTLF